MKKGLFFLSAVYFFFSISGSGYNNIYGLEEKTIYLGGKSTWSQTETRAGIIEAPNLRVNPVLMLCSVSENYNDFSALSGASDNFPANNGNSLDIHLSFDDKNTGFKDIKGNYNITPSQGVELADIRYAKYGNGASLFYGKSGNNSSPLVIEPRSGNALFAAGNRIMDFTIEFYLYPLNLENGEEILTWNALKLKNGKYEHQNISCITEKNKLKWSFENFFISSDGLSFNNFSLQGDSPVIPKTWSHHLIRFDADLGMLEYLVDGSCETIVYLTSGKTNREMYTPIVGSGGAFKLGEYFKGMIDEFKIHKACIDRKSFDKYNPSGGRMETKALDLGSSNSVIVKVNALGGRASFNSKKGAYIDNTFKENGSFRFSDDAQMQFFIRAGENPWNLKNDKWAVFTPGQDITAKIKGRYVQIAVNFYPSADGQSSPYLDELLIVYKKGEPPIPPSNVTVTASDGGVKISWKHSLDNNTSGYLIYYSSVRGEYFGEDAALGPSPIDVGYANNLSIEGLKNGSLYYFVAASYSKEDGNSSYIIGEFSREVTARPLSGLTSISFER